MGVERGEHVAWDRGHAEIQRTATLPAGAYEAFYAFYPAIYWSDTDKPDKQSLLERLWNGADASILETLD